MVNASWVGGLSLQVTTDRDESLYKSVGATASKRNDSQGFKPQSWHEVAALDRSIFRCNPAGFGCAAGNW